MVLGAPGYFVLRSEIVSVMWVTREFRGWAEAIGL